MAGLYPGAATLGAAAWRIPAPTMASIKGRIFMNMQHAGYPGEAGQGLSNDSGQLCCAPGVIAGAV